MHIQFIRWEGSTILLAQHDSFLEVYGIHDEAIQSGDGENKEDLGGERSAVENGQEEKKQIHIDLHREDAADNGGGGWWSGDGVFGLPPLLWWIERGILEEQVLPEHHILMLFEFV